MSFSLTYSDPHRHLDQLLMLNLGLQVFDGVATYQGLRMGWQEANPVLVAAFGVLGVGPALVIFKLVACALLVLVHRHTPVPVGIKALRLLAAFYCTLSLTPWLAKFGYLGASLLWAAMMGGSAATTIV